MTLAGIILRSRLNPLAPVFRLFSILTAVSLLWHRRWLSLGMMAASMLALPLLFALLRFLPGMAGRMAVSWVRRRTSAI